MRAIDPYQDKLELKAIARKLFQGHGWEMPPGLVNGQDRDPLTYSQGEHQQAKRAKRHPKQLKRIFLECWQRSDSQSGFIHAMKEFGFILAKGDRCGHVAVDAQGEVYAISRWVGVKAKEVRARLGTCDNLPSVDDALEYFERSGGGTWAQPDADTEFQQKRAALERRRVQLVESQRRAREKLRLQLEGRPY